LKNYFREIAHVLLASAGIRIDKINKARVKAMLFILVGYGSHLYIAQFVTFNQALAYYLVIFSIRYVYLFAGFKPKGFAPKLIVKYGEEVAWNKYEITTSVLFFQRGLSFGLLTHASKWSLLDFINTHLFLLSAPTTDLIKTVLLVIGLLLVAIGFWVNTAATLIIGIDTYYYKDLFLKRPIVAFKIEGPYKYFSNPMYGIGQSSAYGASLMVGSIAGLLTTLLNQLIMYLFYYVIEKPHIKSITRDQLDQTTNTHLPVVVDTKEYKVFA
jgi:protein-S-isoprenylcysteine O-methyltransferase Ste14